MPNYFSDNKDLLFHFDQLQLQRAVSILEHNYVANPDDPLRPENYQEAVEMYRAALDLCGDISGNFIAERSQAIDKEGAQLIDGKVHYAKATLEAQQCLAEAGFMGVIIPREYGGLNFPATIYIMMIELVSRADASMMTMFGYQDVGEAIAKLAPPEVSADLLPSYCEGKDIGAMVLTEPGGGSDLQAIRVTAKQDEHGIWRLNGIKQFISHGNGGVLLVLAKSETDAPGMFGLSLFAVRGGIENNVNVNRIEDKMGLHGSPTCELAFNSSAAELVGKQRFGLFHVVDILNHARFSVAAQALGIAEASYQAALSYSKERKAFGKLIYNMPPIADMLIDMRVTLDACRAMVYDGSQWLDLRNKLEEHIEELKNSGEKVSKEDRVAFKEAQRKLDLLSPLVKYVVTESANRICYMAQQIHGGMGYIREMLVERCVRDVRITTIYEGTTQIQVGLAIKHVMADVMADFFDKTESMQVPEYLSECRSNLLKLRQLYQQARDIYRDKNNTSFKEAAAKELTNIYASLYAGSLLIKAAATDKNRSSVARRFIIHSLAEARAGVSRLEDDLYSDVEFSDIICQ